MIQRVWTMGQTWKNMHICIYIRIRACHQHWTNMINERECFRWKSECDNKPGKIWGMPSHDKKSNDITNKKCIQKIWFWCLSLWSVEKKTIRQPQPQTWDKLKPWIISKGQLLHLSRHVPVEWQAWDTPPALAASVLWMRAICGTGWDGRSGWCGWSHPR